MKKVHIVPGWAEGNWHFKQFVRGSSEFELERQAEQADIIVAHSSGVYSLPDISPNQTVVLIDPPYWPKRSVVVRAFRHVILDTPKQLRNYGVWFWLRLRFWNIVFLLIEPWRHLKIWRSLKQTFRLSGKGKHSALIWDNRDAYCGPQIKDLVKNSNGMHFIELDGLHETCWAHPQAYLDAIKQL